MPSPLDLSAVQLAALVRAGELSPIELVDAHIRRIEGVNPHINALVGDRFDAARSEARRQEQLLIAARAGGLAGSLPPLFGVPCTIKEFISVEGMSWTAGLHARRGKVAPADATVVARVRGAGALILGVSNGPEGGLWMESVNALYGRTRNPWDLGRTSGGSSGGEGALVAAGASPFGLGSDVGGSVRIPAAFCGVAGHKPTGGLVPNTGHLPAAPARAGTYLCVGPLARSVDDLIAVMGVIAGPDGVDRWATRSFRPPSADGGLAGVDVVALHGTGAVRVREGVRAAVDSAASALEARGARRRSAASMPGLRRALLLWSGMLSAAAEEHYDVILGDGTPISLLPEIGRFAIGRGRHTFAGLALTALDRALGAIPVDLSGVVREGEALRDAVEAALGPEGVLVFPVYSRPAPRHRDPWRTPLDFQLTALFNVLELPATVVPVGADHRGLPLAVQIVAARGRDDLTLRAARALEQDLGGFRRAEPA